MQGLEEIFVTRSSMPTLEEYIEEIRPVFESCHMTNMGPVYKKLQHQLIDYLDVPYLSLFVNGHMALELSFQAMNLCKGEVITTPYTFVSTVHAIVRNGLKPVFCDIRPDDYTMDASKIEALITDKTVAIVPVHVYGNICDVETIESIAHKHHLKVIYDAAHAFGVRYKGKTVGNYGDAVMFSFHATKVFNSIEGGAVAFKDENYRLRLHELKNFGIHGEDQVDNIGANAKLDEFRAAMGICNLRYVEQNIKKRKRIVEIYNSRLEKIKGIRLPVLNREAEHNYAYYPVYIDTRQFGMSRDSLYKLLKEHGIHTRKYFYPAVNDIDCYKALGCNCNTPVARDVSLNILTLPLYAELDIHTVNRICDLIIDSVKIGKANL